MFYYLAMLLTILSNLLYHVFQKAISNSVNPLFSLLFTYITAIILVLVIYPFYPQKTSFLVNLKDLNWASFALGIAIVGLEMGFLLAYRAGWDISFAAIISNVAITILLIPIGVLFFKETLTATNMLGIVVCLIGLALVNYKG